MQKSEIILEGDTSGISFRLPVYRFAGTDASAPKTYMQAALHAEELPGVAALHFLLPMLEAAEARGEILGDITLVPRANPIGGAQWINGQNEGRFDLASRVNFNRDYPLVSLDDVASLLENPERYSVIEQLKRHLLSMAVQSDLMLDLHCDDESLLYAYLHSAYWPAAMDLAESMALEAVLLSDGKSSAFEDAVTYAWEHAELGSRTDWHEGRISLTMEFRGLADVTPDTARRDAEGLYAFLQRRGALAGNVLHSALFTGPVAELDQVEMVNAPAAGMVLHELACGTRVKEGDRLCVIVPVPGEPQHDVVVTAPQDGVIVTRTTARYLRRNDNLMKIAARNPSGAARKPGGALED